MIPLNSTNCPNNSEEDLVNDQQHQLRHQLPPQTDIELLDYCGLDDKITNVSDSDTGSSITGAQKVTVAVLCFVNLINYMDRYTIAGILPNVQQHFGIDGGKGGLLQTTFVISYMIFAPVFGYLGDRYNRKLIMTFGVFLWSLTTFVGSFMDNYYSFLFFRSLVGIGEASYSTIAPTVMSDMFVKNVRSNMLAVFYFAIPVGSGLGYIISSETAKLLGSWQWGLRITPFLGVLAVLMILVLSEEPERGQSEGRFHAVSTSWSEDVKLLTKNRSFVLSTAGFTCVSFVTGALAWWGPTTLWLGFKTQNEHEHLKFGIISLYFGTIAMVAGLIGVPLGAFIAQRLKTRYLKADPIICAVGLLISAPLLFLGLLLADEYYHVVFIIIFFGQVSLNIIWSIAADLLLYVVGPTRRSTAEAFQILFSHLLGDAGSPYLIGVISELLQNTFTKETLPVLLTSMALASNNSSPAADKQSEKNKFYGLQYALFITICIELLGAVFFLFTAYHVVKDKELAEAENNVECIIEQNILIGNETSSHTLFHDIPIPKFSPAILQQAVAEAENNVECIIEQNILTGNETSSHTLFHDIPIPKFSPAILQQAVAETKLQ